ncbi:hypothetical protein H0A73_02225 [Alcaligenaceae bacterium]|nr:hypothetical protein [Alcaligenaceae bacterium]
MRNGIQVGVVGTATLVPRDPRGMALEEALYAASQMALRDAGMTFDDIDGVVVASSDELDGRAISIMAASGSVGGVERDIMSTPSSAEHAFVLGALRVRSGLYRTQLIVSWSPLEVDSISAVQQLGTDPYFHRALPIDELSASAMQASALAEQVPGLHDAAVSIVSNNRKNGRLAHAEFAGGCVEEVLIRGGRMLRWPITEGMVAPPAFCVTALVVANESWIDERKDDKVAWVHGLGWATETNFLGDRDLAALPSLRAAAGQAYGEAGIEGAPEFDLAEVADATPYQALLALEGLGLSERKSWVDDVRSGKFAAGGSLPVNLSGGASAFNPVFCTGLLRIVEAANQTRGCAGRHQHRGVRRAVAHGASGFAMQYNTVVVFGRDRKGDMQ